jgi:N4-(beta-N-acetylglucosaminyl)-L-asparaginase
MDPEPARIATPEPPLILSTWSFGPIANRAALASLRAGASPLDAAVAGATAVEDDPTVDSVGVGGIPDASGRVSLDASVMTDPDRCGSVCFVRGYAHAARMAREVMDRTMHVMLAGDGAEAFAKGQGFPRHESDLLTPDARAAHERWIAARAAHVPAAGEKLGVLPPMNVEERYAQARGTREPMHDTVCVLVRHGSLAGVCTTSGLGHKLPGRVGDSPIVGHGLYVDQQAGAATATGNGELMMGVCGSFLAVELMRQGRTPMEAIVEVLTRISRRYTLTASHQSAMLAVRADGLWASASLRPGFSHCVTDSMSGPERLEPGQRVVLA